MALSNGTDSSATILSKTMLENASLQLTVKKKKKDLLVK